MSVSPSFFPPAPTDVLPRAFGRYTMLVKLASGGMADVFLALHQNELGVEKLVVLKCLREHLREEVQFVEMFVDEARTAATLTHPNIAGVLDVGEVDGVHFIAMEYLEGTDLRHLRRIRTERKQPPMELKHALHVIGRVLSGLEYAHERTDFDGTPLTIVHRDISPQNVIVEFSGAVKIVDFGVAKSALQLSEQSSIGVLKGKAAYMSPEQALGETVDSRTDLFATGIVLYELTTGTRLFKGQSDIDTLQRVLAESFPLPHDVVPDYPAGLEQVVMRSLHRNREDRYQSAREMRLELSRWAESAGVRPSESSFADWLRAEVPELLTEQQELRGRVRSLAGRARSQPPPAGDSEAPRSDRAPPSSRRLTAQSLRDVIPRDAAVPRDLLPPDEHSEPPPSESLNTFRSSVHTVRPPGIEKRSGRRRARRMLASVLVVLAAAVIAVAGGWLRAPYAGRVQRARASAAQRVGAGFRPWWERVHGWMSPASAAAPSTLEVQTGPETASISLDGHAVTAHKVQIARGEQHRLRVTAPGYYPLEMDVRPTRDLEHVHVVLERMPDASASPSAAASGDYAAASKDPKASHRARGQYTRPAAHDADGGAVMWRPKGL